MNALLICGLQVTLVALVGTLTSIWMRRWLRRSATLPIAATLMAIVLLTACAFNSWPSWMNRSGVGPVAAVASSDGVQPVADHARRADMTLETFGWGEAAAAAWRGLMDEQTPHVTSPTNLTVPARSEGWSTLQVVFVLFLVGLSVGVVRLLGGLWSVNHFVQTSRPLKTPSLIEAIDILLADLGCHFPVEVRECRHLATGATVGWRKPVILLSDSWRSWSEAQLRSVLAHEIAHITRGDYLAGVAAQLGVVLHFYHPLVHWLVSRFRLEQELAADEMAAQVVGGSRAYLNAIGELALKQSNETLGWPAQAFLPTRSTFLRRIEMLRDLKLLSGQAPLAIRAGTLVAIAAVTLVAIGLRPPGGENTGSTPVVAADKLAGALSGGQPVASPLEAKYVPLNAAVVMAIRSGEAIRTLKKVSPSLVDPAIGIEPFSDSEQACLFLLWGSGGNAGEGLCLTFANKMSRDKYLEKEGFQGGDVAKKRYLTFQYEVGPNRGGQPHCCYKPDDRTVVLGPEAVIQQVVLGGSNSLSPLTQTPAWNAAVNGTAVLAMDPAVMKQFTAHATQNPILGMLFPLWESAANHTVALNLDQNVNLSLTTQANDEASAEKIKTTLAAGVAMLTNIANNMKQSPDPTMSKTASEGLLPMLSSHQLASTGKEVTLKMTGDAEKLVSILIEPLASARNQAMKAQQKNNLKMIMLALHNYHDVLNQFPPAVVIDPDSGVPHSWRVEILRVMEGEPSRLYQQYKMNEPWDSEANLKVLAQMPDVFKDPGGKEGTTFTSVIAAYGKKLAFEEGDKVGKRIPDFTDGTSNTISIIAAQTEIPWTKPEDITIDVASGKLPPQIGTDGKAFYTGFCDGSVRMVPEKIGFETLLPALTRNGGEIFEGF